MKITDEVKTFAGEDGVTLEVSSNHYGTHELPSAYLLLDDADTSVGFATNDTEQIKEIIEHMAKMAGLDVAFSKRFVPQYQPGDRVRSLHEDHKGQTGTVREDKEHPQGWNVAVVLDGDDGSGLFMYSELERVTKSV